MRMVFTGPAGRRLEEAWSNVEPKCFSEAMRSVINLFYLQSEADRARRDLVSIKQSASKTDGVTEDSLCASLSVHD